MNKYYLRHGTSEVLLFRSPRDFKSKQEALNFIFSEEDDGKLQDLLELKDLSHALDSLKVTVRFSFAEQMIYYPILLAHSNVIKRNQKNKEFNLECDLMPTRYFLKSEDNDVPQVELGSFYYSKDHDADDMFPWFCELSEDAYLKVHGCSIKDSLLKVASGGLSIFATEMDKPTLLFEMESDKFAYGRETTIGYFGFTYIKSA